MLVFDKAFVNGKIHTMDDANTQAEAMLVHDGRILTDQYNGILSNDTQMILNDVNTILWAEYTKIVMGQDIDTFEDAVENWYNNGGNEVTQVVNGQ